MRNYLRDRLAPFGIIVVELSITDFQFSSEFNKAIESKQTAEQHALRAKRDLDRIKVEAQQKIATAQADAEALRLQRQVISRRPHQAAPDRCPDKGHREVGRQAPERDRRRGSAHPDRGPQEVGER